MDNSIIIVLGMILLILIMLNHLTIIVDPAQKPHQGSCAQTTFGCCPDGINSKINFYGTNCPGYKPAPGYPVQPQQKQ
jgi:hypothetical protein